MAGKPLTKLQFNHFSDRLFAMRREALRRLSEAVLKSAVPQTEINKLFLAEIAKGKCELDMDYALTNTTPFGNPSLFKSFEKPGIVCKLELHNKKISHLLSIRSRREAGFESLRGSWADEATRFAERMRDSFVIRQGMTDDEMQDCLDEMRDWEPSGMLNALKRPKGTETLPDAWEENDDE